MRAAEASQPKAKVAKTNLYDYLLRKAGTHLHAENSTKDSGDHGSKQMLEVTTEEARRLGPRT